MSTFQARDFALTSTCISSFREVLCSHKCFIVIIIVVAMILEENIEFEITDDSFLDIH